MSMITATTWVPRGHAAAFPTKYVFDEGEYARISKLAKLELDDAKEELEQARNAMNNGSSVAAHGTVAEADFQDEKNDKEDGDVDLADDDLKEYDLEHYDDPTEAGAEDEVPTEEPLSMFGNIRSLAYHSNNAEDPYITLQENEASDDDEREELQILPTDNLVLVARIEDEVAHLECYVYEDEADNLYVHHDIMLPAIPLCVEWLDTQIGKTGSTSSKGNFAAVGTMDPDIELWDLDTVDCMYPNAILGGSSQPAAPNMLVDPTSKKKKKKKSNKANDSYHVDAVLSLAANRQHKHLLASASADKTIKLWDLNTCTAAHSYAHHTDKVCSLSWHPTQSSVLLSGSYDRTVVAADMRAPSAKSPRWGVESDVEQVRWDPHDENHFYISTENGVLHCCDARQLPSSPETSKAVWRLQAHEKAISSFALNPSVPGYIATGSTDRSIKLWSTAPGTGPSMIVSRDLGVGRVFSTQFAPDEPVAFRLAVAGSKGAVQVWDTSTNRAVREAFAGRANGFAAEDKEERVVGVDEDDSESEDDEEAEGEGVTENDGGGGWESMDED